jgi:hypothetical protein
VSRATQLLLAVVAAVTVGVMAPSRSSGASAGLVVRDCSTSVDGVDAAAVLRRADIAHVGTFVYGRLAYIDRNVQPLGPSGNHDGLYYGIKWSVGTTGSEPLLITARNASVHFDFRLTASTSGLVRWRQTQPTVELRPCPGRAGTFWVGGVVVRDHARCVRVLVRALTTGRRWQTTIGIGRRCPLPTASARGA